MNYSKKNICGLHTDVYLLQILKSKIIKKIKNAHFIKGNPRSNKMGIYKTGTTCYQEYTMINLVSINHMRILRSIVQYYGFLILCPF